MNNTGERSSSHSFPPYKDKMGRWRCQTLFIEFGEHETLKPVFTLKEQHQGDYLSMRQLFLSFDDPTGYEFAKAHLGSYEHWKKLSASTWFKQHLNSWIEELEVKLEAQSLRKIKELADEGSFPASKFLVEKGWAPKRGRPKKEEVQRAAAVAAGVEAAVEDDLERIRLVK
jgi:hypothetical protein